TTASATRWREEPLQGGDAGAGAHGAGAGEAAMERADFLVAVDEHEARAGRVGQPRAGAERELHAARPQRPALDLELQLAVGGEHRRAVVGVREADAGAGVARRPAGARASLVHDEVR